MKEQIMGLADYIDHYCVDYVFVVRYGFKFFYQLYR